MKNTLYIFLSILFANCGRGKQEHYQNNRNTIEQKSGDNREDYNSSSSNSGIDDDISKGGYEDGTYCARVDYHYSRTGTNSTYTLEVEIEDNELTVIHWPNGGWLDQSHFYPPDISDGSAHFTSDKGVDYDVQIIGEEGDCVIDYGAKHEDDLIEDADRSDEIDGNSEELDQSDEEDDDDDGG